MNAEYDLHRLGLAGVIVSILAYILLNASHVLLVFVCIVLGTFAYWTYQDHQKLVIEYQRHVQQTSTNNDNKNAPQTSSTQAATNNKAGGRVVNPNTQVPPPPAPSKTSIKVKKAMGARELFEAQHLIPSEIAVELGVIVDLTIETWISSWYKWISNDPELTNDVTSYLCHIIGELGKRRRRQTMMSMISLR